jgi:hypothetical protein
MPLGTRDYLDALEDVAYFLGQYDAGGHQAEWYTNLASLATLETNLRQLSGLERKPSTAGETRKSSAVVPCSTL